MTDSDTFAFGKFVPGFDFLRQLAQSGAGMPGVAPLPGLALMPTVSVEELDKRIRELKAVQFWLEQNGAGVKATIQALEVQKMTLAALAGMNLNVAQMAKAFTAVPSVPASKPTASAPPEAPAAPTAAAKSDAPPQDDAEHASAATASDRDAAAGLVDPLQWWGALTQQFQQIATETIREAARAAPKAAGNTERKRANPEGSDSAAVKKPAVKKATAKKAAAKKTPAKKAAPASAAPHLPGWQLPPPFKLPKR